jgi:hypothetical protein
MNAKARLARLERRQQACGEASDQEHLRVSAAIVLARHRGDDAAVAALSARLACLPPPTPGGALDTVLRYAARLGRSDGEPDEHGPELLVGQTPIDCRAQVAIQPAGGPRQASHLRHDLLVAVCLGS